MTDQLYSSLPHYEDLETDQEEKRSQSKAQRAPFRGHRPIRGLFNITLLISLIANAFFLHQQYVMPWELADGLPSKFGLFTLESTSCDICSASTLSLEHKLI